MYPDAESSGNFFYFAISLLPVLFESLNKISVFDGLIGTALFGIIDVIFVFDAKFYILNDIPPL